MSEENKDEHLEVLVEEVDTSTETTESVEVAEEVTSDDVNRDGDVTVATSDTPDVAGDGDQGPPSFFVEDEDRCRVEVDVLFDHKGKLVSISRKGLGIDFTIDGLNTLRHYEEWLEFSVPTYEQLANYRQQSAVFREGATQAIVDKSNFRNYIIVWHLKDWSLRGRDGEKIELTHDDNGSLTAQSINEVYKTVPTLMDVVMTTFEKDALLM